MIHPSLNVIVVTRGYNLAVSYLILLLVEKNKVRNGVLVQLQLLKPAQQAPESDIGRDQGECARDTGPRNHAPYHFDLTLCLMNKTMLPLVGEASSEKEALKCPCS